MMGKSSLKCWIRNDTENGRGLKFPVKDPVVRENLWVRFRMGIHINNFTMESLILAQDER
jgi:hypothetical protein